MPALPPTTPQAPPHGAMDIHLADTEASNAISAVVQQGDAPPIHFATLPELIRWLALLELAQRRSPGGIR